MSKDLTLRRINQRVEMYNLFLRAARKMLAEKQSERERGKN